MNRRGLLLGLAAGIAPAPAFAVQPSFDAGALAGMVFDQVYDAYDRRKPRSGWLWERHADEYSVSDTEIWDFYRSARDHLVGHFNVTGWPREKPDLFIIPPDRYEADFVDVLGGRGLIGCIVADRPRHIWRLLKVGWVAASPVWWTMVIE